MHAIILTGPAVEPIPLAEMKAHLRLDTDDEDALVTSLVRAARLTVEAATRLALIEQTWRVSVSRWPADRRIRLPIGPVLAITAARLRAPNGGATSFASSLLRIDAASDRFTLAIDAAAPDPVGDQLIEIDLAVGFGATASSVPETLRLATKLLAARWFTHRGDDEPGEAALPPDVAILLRPHARPRLA